MTLRFPAPMTAADFLRDCWQTRPVLCSAALGDEIARLDDVLSPEILAGLACESGVEARLVISRGPADQWVVRHGPFFEQDFIALPATGWSLLVQDVDKYIPQIAALLDQFDFLPAWRIDDIMVSYAVPGGTVGPHIDEYDVFLVQGTGQRTWEIGDSDGTLLEDAPLRVVQRFNPTETFRLSTGDALYLPPGVAHHGHSDSSCMTLSVGFRAPSVRELILAEAEQRAERAVGRYRDAGLGLDEAHDGLIAEAAVDRAAMSLGRKRAEADDILWFGCLVTENKPWLQAEAPENPGTLAQFTARLNHGATLVREPGSRVARSESPAPGMLFIDGAAWPLSDNTRALARDLSRGGAIPAVRNDEAISLLYRLYCEGKIDWQDPP